MSPGPLGLSFPVLDEFLGVSASEFFEREWRREVKVFPAGAGPDRLRQAAVDFRNIVASGFEVERVESLGGKDRTGPGPGEPGWPETPDAASARVTRAQDHSAVLNTLCRQMTDEVSHRVSVNLYVSPPKSRGLDRHQDGHDVLVLQLEGEKRWRIWPNQAPPPLDSLPSLTFEGQKRFRNDYRGTPFGGRGVDDGEITGRPDINLTLKAGDLIYVPGGFAHEVWTEESFSAHLTFGFHLVSWVDVMMTVVAHASRSRPEFRAGLPIGFARVAPDRSAVQEKGRSLLPLLADVDPADAMEEVIGRWLHREMSDAPTAPPTPRPDLRIDDTLRLRRRFPSAFITRDESVGLFRPFSSSPELWLPKAFAAPLKFIATIEPPVFDVAQMPGVSASSRARLCRLLIAEGYLEPADAPSPISPS